MFLDCEMVANRRGLPYLQELAGTPARKFTPAEQRFFDRIDWDPVLRQANRYYDRLVAALRLEDRRARKKQLAEINNALEKLKEDAGDRDKLLNFLTLDPDTPGEVLGEKIGNVLIPLLLPNLTKVSRDADNAEQRSRILLVAFALEAYRRENKEYPEKLKNLTPRYLPRLPVDLGTGKELKYRRTSKGYVLSRAAVVNRKEKKLTVLSVVDGGGAGSKRRALLPSVSLLRNP